MQKNNNRFPLKSTTAEDVAIHHGWVWIKQKWVSFSLFANECRRTKMGF
jgi:hypothetical protein